jgi:K+-sensing histidine kinase KdpD
MINEVLDLSKIEAETVTVRCIPYIRPFLRAGGRVPARAVKSTSALLSLDGAIQWDRNRSSPASASAHNLIGNAKFTDTGEVSVRVQRINNQIRFEVKDTGKGIPEKDLPNLFKAFFQASNNDRASQGVGLGLYISKIIIGLLGGELHVKSSIGSGSTFWFDLPVQEVSIPKRRLVTAGSAVTRAPGENSWWWTMKKRVENFSENFWRTSASK